MGFNLFKTKRSAPAKKQVIEAGPPRPATSQGMSSISRPYLFPNPLALNPPNRLHFSPNTKGKEETTRVLSGDLAAVLALSGTIVKADRLSKTAPDLNLRGLGATQWWLKSGGVDRAAVDELLADQARAEERLRDLKKRRTGFMRLTNESLPVLPAATFGARVATTSAAAHQTSDSTPAEAETSRKSSFDIDFMFGDILPGLLVPCAAEDAATEAGCDACQSCFEKCSACSGKALKAANTPTIPLRSRNPSPKRLARLDDRPLPVGVDPESPFPICPSLLSTPDISDASSSLWCNTAALASLSGSEEDEDEEIDDDATMICQVAEVQKIGVRVYRDVSYKVINIEPVVPARLSSPHVRPLTLVSRLAVPADRPRRNSLPFSLQRPDSPTLPSAPSALPAPLFSTKKWETVDAIELDSERFRNVPR